jgi:hypothetical protein
MIGIDPEAALEILDARDLYEARRVGLGLPYPVARKADAASLTGYR